MSKPTYSSRSIFTFFLFLFISLFILLFIDIQFYFILILELIGLEIKSIQLERKINK